MRITYLHLVSASLLVLFVCALLPKISLAVPADPTIRWSLKLRKSTDGKKILAYLENVGQISQWAVQVNDGSESGWREPSVSWEVQALVDNKWSPVPKKTYGRCGLYAADWQKDVVQLQPGEGLELAMDWLGDPNFRFETTETRSHRVRLNYDYSGGKKNKGGIPPTTKLNPSLGLEYEVVSNWIEL